MLFRVGIWPAKFIYGYVQDYQDPNLPNNTAQVLVITANPNDCDTGTLTLHVGEPTFTAIGDDENTHGQVDLPMVANITSFASEGECNLLGGGDAIPYVGTITVHATVSEPNSTGYGYDIAAKNAPLLSDPLVAGLLTAKFCKISTAANPLVPCVK